MLAHWHSSRLTNCCWCWHRLYCSNLTSHAGSLPADLKTKSEDRENAKLTKKYFKCKSRMYISPQVIFFSLYNERLYKTLSTRVYWFTFSCFGMTIQRIDSCTQLSCCRKYRLYGLPRILAALGWPSLFICYNADAHTHNLIIFDYREILQVKYVRCGGIKILYSKSVPVSGHLGYGISLNWIFVSFLSAQ